MVVHQIRNVGRFKSGQVSDLVLSEDFARRDLFREVVSMIGNHAFQPEVLKFSLLHPNLLVAFGSEFKINALLHVVASVREETETPLALFLAGEGCVADIDVPQVVPAVAVVTVSCIRRVEAHPGIFVPERVGDAESDGLTVIEGQDLEVR